MAYACVVIKKGLNADMGASSALVDAISVCGYSFVEFHILSETDEKNILALLNRLQENGIKVLLFAEEDVDAWKERLSACKTKDCEKVFFNPLEATVYALNENSIEKELVESLKERKLKISVAESFTGGGVAKRITSVSGASEVFFEGVNAYNEAAKIKRLGVSERTLQEMGAVSKETACEMAQGLLNTGACDIAVATTGLAGPNSDGSGKPIGLCYIAVGTKVDVQVYEYVFNGTRQEIVEKGIESALQHAYKIVKI